MWAKPTLYKFLPMVEPVSKSCRARSVGGSYADSTKFHLDGAIVADAMIDFAYGEIPTRTGQVSLAWSPAGGCHVAHKKS